MRLLAIKISAIALGGLVSFVILEVALRFLPYNSGMVASQVDDRQPVYRFLADRDVRYSQDWDMKNSRIRHVNKDGFLSDIEYNAEDNRPLMAVIGDSFVEAIQVDWTASVHGLLHQRLAPDVRVYAFGAAYASLAQYLAWSAYAQEAFEPDMLVVNVVGNDFLQELPKPGEKFGGGFLGMNFFAEDMDGALVVRRSDRPPETWLKLMARQSAVIAYAYRNAQITSTPMRIKALFRSLFAAQKAPVYIGNTLAKVDDDRLDLSKREVRRFLELLPSMSGLAPRSIVITIDGLRPNLYDAARLAKAENSFPATMARYLIRQGTALGYEVIHLEPRFIEEHQKSGKRFEFPYNNHWNANGHIVMSEAVQSSRTFARIFKP